MHSAAALTLASATYLTISLVVLARRKSGYGHVRHTISELGESGARDQRRVALGVFAPVGIAMLSVAYLLRSHSSAAAALALAIGVGYVGAAVFPCDPGSPLSGTWRQSLHNLAGGVEYIGGGFALLTLARDSGMPFQIGGIAVLAVAIALTVFPAMRVRGFVQRIAEACLFGGLAWAAWEIS